jgi:hypothetical protein
MNALEKKATEIKDPVILECQRLGEAAMKEVREARIRGWSVVKRC